MTDPVQARERARRWWDGLSPDWQRALERAVGAGSPGEDAPDPDRLVELHSLETLRLAGPGAPYPNLDFELTDLSGVAGMRSLRFLSITDMAITSLQPLAGLARLEALFVQDNRIESLAGIEGLTRLKSLYCQGNRIESLAPIEALTGLKTVYASRNRITRLDGLHAGHVPTLEHLFVLPNESLDPREIVRVQTELGLHCRRG